MKTSSPTSFFSRSRRIEASLPNNSYVFPAVHPNNYSGNFPLFFNPLFSISIPFLFLHFFLFLCFGFLRSKGGLSAHKPQLFSLSFSVLSLES
uniref:Uncharacterized protein n=1 Tax=Arundo donax TaxID=35708 RepID=A0A0A9FKP7_ARUDO